MSLRRLATAFGGAAWLVMMGAVMSQAHASPITYNITDLGRLAATGFDSSGNLVGQVSSDTGFIYTTSGSSAGMLQVVPNASTPGSNWPVPGPPPGYQWDSVHRRKCRRPSRRVYVASTQ